jgi:hypothetical protein
MTDVLKAVIPLRCPRPVPSSVTRVPSEPGTSLEHTHPVSTSSHLSPYSLSFLSHAHRFMGFFCNRNSLVSDSVSLMNYSVSDSTVAFTPAPSPSSLSSVSHTHIIHTPTLHTPTFLTMTYTQVLWFLARLTRPPASYVTTASLTVWFTRTTQCM